MKYQIRQLGVGGILDQSITIVRDHAPLLFTIVGVTIVPLQTVFGLIQTKLQEAVRLQDQGTAMTLSLLIIPVLFLLMAALILVNASVIHAVAAAYLERQTSVGSCFRHGLSRFLPLLGTSILVGLATFGGLLLCVIPGIIFALWFGLAQHVTVLESMAGTQAMTRSRELMKGNILTAIALGLIVLVINFSIAGAAGLIPEQHLRVVAAALIQGVMTVFGTAAAVVFYFSCRCKLDNFDLVMLADAVVSDEPVKSGDGVDAIEP